MRASSTCSFLTIAFKREGRMSSSSVSEHGAGGYDLKFISTPHSSLECPICMLIVREPWQEGKCGNLFCKSCLKQCLRGGRACPYCGDENPRYFEDKRSHREVQDLIIKCENSHLGCEWTGELRALEEHCPYTIITCPSKCLSSDGKEFKCFHKDLDKHMDEKCPKRKFMCPHCQEPGCYEERTTTHLEDCLMVPTKCPNKGCDEELPYFKVANHVKVDCGFTHVKCKYHPVGCTEVILRKDLEEHEADETLHFNKSIVLVPQQERKLTQQEWKLTEQETKLTEQQTKLTQQETKLAQQDRKLTDQKERLKRTERTVHLLKTQVSQLPIMQRRTYCISYTSTSCKTAYCLPFYTAQRGYCVRLCVHPKGFKYARYSHVSIYIQILKGNNDSSLKWPFAGVVTFELLNRLGNRKHHILTQEVTDADVGDFRGINKFIALCRLYHDPVSGIQYLKDDSLYFRVSVSHDMDYLTDHM